MWLHRQKTADLVTSTEEILNKKLHFLCSELLSEKSIHAILWSTQRVILVILKFLLLKYFQLLDYMLMVMLFNHFAHS